MEERRIHARWSGASDVWLDAETEPPCVVEGQLKDASMTGLSVFATQGLPEGTRVAVRVASDNGRVDETMHLVRGKVIGNAAGPDVGNLHCIRVCYTQANNPLLEQLVSQLQLTRQST